MARRSNRSAAPRRTGSAVARRIVEVEKALQTAVEALTALEARFALVGGLAITVRAEPRFTGDVDLAVAVVDDAQAEQLVASLQSRGWALRTLIEQVAVGRLGTARFQLPGRSPGLRVDLLFSATGIEAEIVSAATPSQLPTGTRVVTASVGHLIAMKCLSESDERLQDRIDLRNLVSVARDADLAVARRAIKAIAKGGLARKKNLTLVLERFLEAR